MFNPWISLKRLHLHLTVVVVFRTEARGSPPKRPMRRLALVPDQITPSLRALDLVNTLEGNE